MVDVSIGGIPESTTVADDNVVAFPTLMSGGLADLMASASAPGTPHELRHEMTARADFRSQATSRMQPRRLRWRKPLGIAVATGACLITTTTGLAAATGFPQSAARNCRPDTQSRRYQRHAPDRRPSASCPRREQSGHPRVLLEGNSRRVPFALPKYPRLFGQERSVGWRCAEPQRNRRLGVLFASGLHSGRRWDLRSDTGQSGPQPGDRIPLWQWTGWSRGG